MKRAREKSVYRLLLVGKTGSGKSATGNWILGRPAFKSMQCSSSVTRDISVSECTDLHDNNILIVDTPGLFDLKESKRYLTNKIQDSLKFLWPGPHAFLLVLRADRITEEDIMTRKILSLMFGPKCFEHAIIILTHIDRVGNIKQFLHQFEENEITKSLFNLCRRRIIIINNNEKDMDIIQRERKKLLLMVDELTDNGMQHYQYDPLVYKDSLEMHAEEWIYTRRDKRESQKIFQDRPEEMNREEIKRQKRDIPTKDFMEEELKTAPEEGYWKTVPSEFIRRIGKSILKFPATLMEAATSFFPGFFRPTTTTSSDAARRDFETSLSKLSFHLQNSMQRKLKEKRTECIIRWEERSYPEIILKAVKELDKAKSDKNWEECMQKANATVEMIQNFPQKELPEKQELLTYIYSYFSPTSLETGEFMTTIGYHDKNSICAMEKLLTALPEEKYQYEAALLYFEVAMRHLALHGSFDIGESFKSRSLTAARKTKDEQIQLYVTVLFIRAEWMASLKDMGPAKEREYLFRVAFSMERCLQLAQYLDDKTATQDIDTILQEVEVRCKRPYPKEIDCWMRRKLSKKIKYPWINKREEKTFSPENVVSEESETLASLLVGLFSQSINIKKAIRHGDVVCIQQYLENQAWEHEDELLDCLDYSLAFCDSDGKQAMAKHFLSWICKELTKSHQPDNVSVWAASIAKQYSTNSYMVLVCNYLDNVNQKFKDKCFFGLPVIYQEYNTVSDEDQYVQSLIFETLVSPNNAIHANEIISLNAERLMQIHSNLEVIKPCPARSTLLEVKKETCIVLYCRMKGFIPFGECQFPTSLSTGAISFPVDVREGFYVPAMLQEGVERQRDTQLFRMGYSMGPHDKEISATVGPFVQMGRNNVGFLTCAHAFGVPCNIQAALGMPVVHPAKGEFFSVNPVLPDESICGFVDRIAFDIDPNHRVNVDAALIQLKPEKIPNKGRFARNLDTADPNRRHPLSFDHGEIMAKEIVENLSNHQGKIIKVGAASGVTSSNLFYNGRDAIRIRDAELTHEHGHIFLPINEGIRSYIMKGQYLIRSRPDSVFLIAGDSGSGVFYIDQSSKLRCIGIAIGFLASTYEAVVTPIEDVLGALGLDENALMRFSE